MSEAASLRHIVDAAVQKLGDKPGPLLEILHQVHDEMGHVPAEAVPMLAEALNLSRAEVHGVFSFYHYFRRKPAGRCVVQVCRAEACLAMNGEALANAIRAKLGIEFGQTSADGRVSLEAVYCLGNCACAPSITVGGMIHGRCTPGDLDRHFEGWSIG